jgi:hypothetical protein
LDDDDAWTKKDGNGMLTEVNQQPKVARQLKKKTHLSPTR